MKAIKSIRMGEELTRCYVDVCDPYEVRTQGVSSFGVVCKCERCEFFRNNPQFVQLEYSLHESQEKLVNEFPGNCDRGFLAILTFIGGKFNSLSLLNSFQLAVFKVVVRSLYLNRGGLTIFRLHHRLTPSCLTLKMVHLDSSYSYYVVLEMKNRFKVNIVHTSIGFHLFCHLLSLPGDYTLVKQVASYVSGMAERFVGKGSYP